MSPVSSYSAYRDTPVGSTGTGLDQVLAWIARDPGLAGANEAASIATGLAAANALHELLVEGLHAIGAFDQAVLSVADIVALNAWFRDPNAPERLEAFRKYHGNDENGSETGFHTIQNDGGNLLFDGHTLIDTVLDGIYHIGFPLSTDGSRLTNEDGADNARLVDVARWLTALKVDLAGSGSDLDRIVETIVADPGLQAAIPWADIRGGAEAAAGLNQLILEGIAALNDRGLADADPTRVSAAEVRWINGWIKGDPSRYARFLALHGNDESGSETGYHLVQNDGATSQLFGLNAVDTVYDGLYHIGFTINADGRFQNEDGKANALLSDVAEWLTFYYGDPSNTGGGLDRLVDWIRLDPDLSRYTSARDINDGLMAANALNQLLLDAIAATGVRDDGWISRTDLRQLNQWVRQYRYEPFVLLHGDDEGGSETGFHTIQNDGASSEFFGRNLVNTVADGIYHYGFGIIGENFVNEDGDTNQSLSDVSGWLNYFLADRRLTLGTEASESLNGNGESDQLLGHGDNDTLAGGDGDDLLDGGWGDDSLLGGNGNDLLDGGFGNDRLDGGEGSDTYLASGADPDNPDWQTYSFQGQDVYADSGREGVDEIRAEGTGSVDIGLQDFGPGSGIERIVNATGAGRVRLLGNWQANSFDFSATELVGGSFSIDSGDGQDSVVGTSGVDDIRGGRDSDLLDGAGGGDTYRVSGHDPNWLPDVPYTFEGHDTYLDSGRADDGCDTIVAEGNDAVDIGLLRFGADSGIERILNATGSGQDGTALVRLLGNWQDNGLDFSATELVNGNVLIDGAEGNDTIVGSGGADRLRGGQGDDRIDGGAGGDRYEVSGNTPEWIEGQPYRFEGFDRYSDSGQDGVDELVALGDDVVDLGLQDFGPECGIERIVNATAVLDDAGNLVSAELRLLGDWQGNRLDFSATELVGGSIVIDGGGGDDTLVGSTGDDRLRGGRDSDWLDGGGGGDLYEVSGQNPDNQDWSSYDFEGFDTYADSGAASDGCDAIVAVGWGAVDIGLLQINASSGIEEIHNATCVDDGNGGFTTALVTLIGNWQANALDFSGIAFKGGNIRIVGGDGNDTITGTSADDRIAGGRDNDVLQGGGGDDTYEVHGRDPANTDWSTASFEGYDTYADSSGNDRLVAFNINPGEGVDIGLLQFGPASGIELIDASAVEGAVRLLGDWQANSLNFSATELRGSSFSIELGDGNDSCVGSGRGETVLGGYGNDQISTLAGDDTIRGDGGNDGLDGGEGSDTYLVNGQLSDGWQGFGDYDTYADSGLSGQDRIVAYGCSDVDIGLAGGNFLASAGIEEIVNSTTRVENGVSGAAQVRLLGNWEANTLTFAGMRFLGGNIVIVAGDGKDTVIGSVDADLIQAGKGDDSLDGGGGADIYEVAGNQAAGSFEGYDTITDRGGGTGEIDRIVAAAGTAAVDIGLRSFSSANGIEVIDASATTGVVRLLGDASANVLNFSGISLLGSTLRIDSGDGNDTITGSAGADTILAGLGVDSVTGGDGDDTISGGGGLDKLTGGNGADTFVYTQLTDGIVGGTTSARTFEKITGFTVGLDRFDVTTAPASASFRQLGALSGLTNASLASLLSSSNFVANGAATFTYGSGTGLRTFLAFNDGSAGFSATADAVLEITGYGYAAGFSSLAQISIV